MIIGFTGKATAGKDTCAGIAKELIDGGERDRVAHVEPFAWELKFVCSQIWPEPEMGFFSRPKEEEIKPGLTRRAILQRVGVAVREIDPEAWINCVLAKHRKHLPRGVTLVSDVRFLNEAAAVRSAGGRIVRVLRDVPPPVGGVANHISETEMDQIEADYVVDNNGSLEVTREQVEWMLKELELA